MGETKRIDDGGPAFPQAMDAGTGTQPASGMSLRDWFAGQVISALWADDTRDGYEYDQYAADAYVIADAMLAARKAVRP